MNMAELSTLPLAERMLAMEVLWESLIKDSAYDPSPAWHVEVLEQRVREIEAGQACDWTEAKNRVLAKAASLNQALDV